MSVLIAYTLPICGEIGFRTEMRLNGNWRAVQSIIFIVEFIRLAAVKPVGLTGKRVYKYEKSGFRRS